MHPDGAFLGLQAPEHAGAAVNTGLLAKAGVQGTWAHSGSTASLLYSASASTLTWAFTCAAHARNLNDHTPQVTQAGSSGALRIWDRHDRTHCGGECHPPRLHNLPGPTRPAHVCPAQEAPPAHNAARCC